ncbi:hypothetical protein ACRQ1B_27950 [Rhizobium panacihumi]|uniref:hypothetical protein n=1 Tax=Rhizobium panacihumi TaxID=2008450 RepID=UPI003D7B13E2
MDYHPRMLPKLRALLDAGRDESEIAAWFGVSVRTLRRWADEHSPLKQALDSREDIREWDEPRNLKMAYALSSRGATSVEIAQAFNVSSRTLARWRQRCPEFDEALTMGFQAQLKVAEQTLFNVATGYVYEQEKAISTKDGVTKVIEQKISHPNPAMLRMFLEANKPEKYRASAKAPEEGDLLSELLREVQERETSQVSINYKDAG